MNWKLTINFLVLETDKGTHGGAKEMINKKKYRSYPELSTSAQLKGNLTSLQTYNTNVYNAKNYI